MIGVEEVVDCSLKVGSGIGRPDLISDPEEFRPGGVRPERVCPQAHPARVQGGREDDVVAGGAEHLGRMAGDGDLVVERSGRGKAMAPAVPVVDLLEASVLQELGGEVVGGAFGHDTATQLVREGDGRCGHWGLLGSGDGVIGENPQNPGFGPAGDRW